MIRVAAWRGALLAAAVTASVLLPAIVAPAARAASPTDCSTAYAGPVGSRTDGTSYFALDVDAGASGSSRLVVANPSSQRCTVRLQAAVGRTAINSGNSYSPSAGTGVGSWVQGLPATLNVPPRSRRTVRFTVAVPSGTAGGQYLAGILVSPMSDDGSTRSGGQVQMRVTTRVAVGVAVTVPGSLAPAVSISRVAVDTSEPPARTVRITERDTGNTWEHPHGHLIVHVDGTTVNVPITSSTILPGSSARLEVGADQVAAGTYPARVELQYADGSKQAVWSGRLTFTQPASTTRKGSTVIMTAETTPAWLPALVGTTAGLGVIVLLLLFLLVRRRRKPGGTSAANP